MKDELEIMKEEAEKTKAVVSVIPENYLTENRAKKSKILYKHDSSDGHAFVEIVSSQFLEREVEIDNEKLFNNLKRSYCDGYDNINEFMNSLQNLKSKHDYVIVTKTATYGNTQVRNFVKEYTPNYQWTKAYEFGLFVHIESLLNIWNNFKPDFASIDEAKKQEQKVRYDFGIVQEVKRQVKIRNHRIKEYKEDLEFFDRNSLEAEIQNQTLRVVKTVRHEPSETEDRFHRVLRIIEKLHPKSQSNIKSSEWTSSGEGYELRQWKKELTVTREQYNNHVSYLANTKLDDFNGSKEQRNEYINANKVNFRDLTISLLDLDEANHDILNLVLAVAKMIEDIVLN